RVAVFGMHHDQDAVTHRLVQGAHQGAVVDHVRAAIRHKQLDAGDPAVWQSGDFVENGRIQVVDHGMKAVVDGGLISGAIREVVEHIIQASAFLLHAEVDDGGRTTAGSRDGSRQVVVGGCGG